MATQTFDRIKLGLFVTVGTVLFILTMYFLGDRQNLFGTTFEIRAFFNNVNGLQKGNNVRFSGINVGTVKSVTIVNDTTIDVVMMIEEDVKKFIRKDAIASLGNDGLMGSKLINISPGSSVAQSVEEYDVLLSINELDADEMLRRLEQTNDNIAVITSSLVTIIEKVNNGEGTIGMLLNDTNLSQDVNQTLANINELSFRTAAISRSIEESIGQMDLNKGTVGTLLTDTIFAKNMAQTMEDLKEISANTDKITQELKTILDDVKQGEGTAGALLTDTTLSGNLEKSMINLQLGTKAFNENMEALKHNFLFRRYFKKLEKKKNKQGDN